MGFTLYDPNMNEIKYPVGVTPLDISVSSIEKERYATRREGKPGTIDNGFDYKDREIKINFSNEHYHDTHDYRLQRDDLYGLLDRYPYMYISDDKVPSRVLSITVDSSYLPERYGFWYSNIEITPSITGIPFWRTTYTTQQIETFGYDAIQNKFGLADGINLDYPNYSFTETNFSVWNGGNVWVDYRNMDLIITVEGLTTSGNFQIRNLTTQETFIYKEAVNNQTLKLDGPLILVGVNNRLRDTNRQFIKLGPGKNDFQITGGTFSKIKFDFRFYNK